MVDSGTKKTKFELRLPHCNAARGCEFRGRGPGAPYFSHLGRPMMLAPDHRTGALT